MSKDTGLTRRLVGRFAMLGLLGSAIMGTPAAFGAVNPHPSVFFGNVTAGDARVPDGTVVSAWIGGVRFAEAPVYSVDGSPVYLIAIPADIPETQEIEGGQAGQPIVFKVLDADTTETAVWELDGYSHLDLTAPVGPDLSVSIEDETSAVEPGDTISYTVTVNNLGGYSAGNVVLTDTLPSSTTFLSASDAGSEAAGIVSWPLFDLAPESAVTRTVIVQVAEVVPPGVTGLTNTATVTDDGTVGLDPNPDNNIATDTNLVRTSELPDLAIGFDNFETDPAEPRPGEPVEVNVTIRNAGTSAAEDVILKIFSGDPAAGGSSLFVDQIAEIPASGNHRVTFTWYATPGFTTLTAVADPEDVIREYSEANNQAQRHVAVPRVSAPDLVISIVDTTGLSQSPVTLALHGTADLEIRNLGGTEVDAPFVVRLFQDTDGDGIASERDLVVATATVADPVPAGGAHFISVSLDATTSFFHPLIWAEVDAGHAITEEREDNNLTTLFGDCERDQPAVSVIPEAEWFLPGIEVETAPVVVQLSDDNADATIDSRDVPDIVFLTEDAQGRAVTAVSGLDGTEVWTFRSSSDNPLPLPIGHLAAADLDGDGVAEVIAPQR
ncbi:MAG: DUF11 domain-containing protein, partial [bacterium]|nr:DUF11 domain-containing protein [bacterium]